MENYSETGPALNGDLAEEARTGVARVKEIGRDLGEKAVRTGKAALHDVGEKAGKAGKAALQNVAARADDFSKDLTILTENGVDMLRQRVAANPLTSLGIAAVIGAIFAASLRR